MMNISGLLAAGALSAAAGRALGIKASRVAPGLAHRAGVQAVAPLVDAQGMIRNVFFSASGSVGPFCVLPPDQIQKERPGVQAALTGICCAWPFWLGFSDKQSLISYHIKRKMKGKNISYYIISCQLPQAPHACSSL
jgi:hypothetical protein